MRRLSSYAFLLGLILFGVILLKMVDLSEAWRLLRSANSFWVAASFLFLIPEIVFKGRRLSAMAQTFHSPLTAKQGTWLYLAGQPLSSVTPSKLGDIVRVVGIHRWGVLRIHSAFAIHAADKIYDILTLGLLAAIGLITLIAQNQYQASALAALLGIALGILLMVLFLHPQWMQRVIKPVLLFLAPKRLAEQVRAQGREIYKDLLALFQPLGRVLFPSLLSAGAWGSLLVRAYFCALALGLPISFTHIALRLPIVIVLEFLPISILGFGTREAALFLFFSSSQVDKSSLLSFSMMLLVIGQLTVGLVGIPFFMKLIPFMKPAPAEPKKQ
jgi:glycosyltransferase 2 family protein